MNKHTPEPWTFEEDGAANQFHIFAGGKWLLSLLHNGEQLTEQQRANLQRIVDCVNNHEQLIDALKDLTRFAYEDFKPRYGPRSKAYTDAFHKALNTINGIEPQPEGWLLSPGRSADTTKACPECKGMRRVCVGPAGSPALPCGFCKGKGTVPA